MLELQESLGKHGADPLLNYKCETFLISLLRVHWSNLGQESNKRLSIHGVQYVCHELVFHPGCIPAPHQMFLE